MQNAATTPLSEFQLTVARLVLGLANSWEVPPVADRALSNGVYCDAFAELASLTSPIMSDVKPLVERALTELDLRTPSHKEAALMLVQMCVGRIVKGEEIIFNVLGELYDTWTALTWIQPSNVNDIESLELSRLLELYGSMYVLDMKHYGPEDSLNTEQARQEEAVLEIQVREEAAYWLARHSKT